MNTYEKFDNTHGQVKNSTLCTLKHNYLFAGASVVHARGGLPIMTVHNVGAESTAVEILSGDTVEKSETGSIVIPAVYAPNPKAAIRRLKEDDLHIHTHLIRQASVCLFDCLYVGGGYRTNLQQEKAADIKCTHVQSLDDPAKDFIIASTPVERRLLPHVLDKLVIDDVVLWKNDHHFMSFIFHSAAKRRDDIAHATNLSKQWSSISFSGCPMCSCTLIFTDQISPEQGDAPLRWEPSPH